MRKFGSSHAMSKFLGFNSNKLRDKPRILSSWSNFGFLGQGSYPSFSKIHLLLGAQKGVIQEWPEFFGLLLVITLEASQSKLVQSPSF